MLKTFITRLLPIFCVLCFHVVAPFAAEYTYHPAVSLRLGAGTDPRDPLDPFPYCFQFESRDIAGTAGSSEFTLKQVKNRRDLMEQLGVSISLSGRYKFFSGGAKLSLDENYAFSSDSLTWIIFSKSDFGRKELSNERLLPQYEQMLTDGENAKFAERCGQELVTQERREAVVAAIFTVSNVSESRQKQLQASLEAAVNTGIFSADGAASYRSFVSQAAETSAISLHVETIGGPGGGDLGALITDYGDLTKISTVLRKYVEATNASNALTVSYTTTKMSRYGWKGSLLETSLIDQTLADYYIFYQDVKQIKDRATTIVRSESDDHGYYSLAEIAKMRDVERESDTILRSIIDTARKCKHSEADCITASNFTRPSVVWPNPEPIGTISIISDDVRCEFVGIFYKDAKYFCSRRVSIKVPVRFERVQSMIIYDDANNKVNTTISEPRGILQDIESSRYLAKAVRPFQESASEQRSDVEILNEFGVRFDERSAWRFRTVSFEIGYGTVDPGTAGPRRVFTLKALDQKGAEYERTIYLK